MSGGSMTRTPSSCALALALLLPVAGYAQAESPSCKVSPYQGATQPQGAVATVEMANRGLPCLLPNYGLPAERANPATAGRIIKAPRNGTASFAPPNASYLPQPGFAGEDEFQYEAWAAGRSGRQHRLLVTVKVKVGSK